MFERGEGRSNMRALSVKRVRGVWNCSTRAWTPHSGAHDIWISAFPRPVWTTTVQQVQQVQREYNKYKYNKYNESTTRVQQVKQVQREYNKYNKYIPANLRIDLSW